MPAGFDINKKHQFNFGYLVIAFLAITLFQMWMGSRSIEQLSYSDFTKLLDQQQVAEVSVSQDRIQGKFKSPHNGKDFFVTRRVDPQFAARLEKAGVKQVTGISDTNWFTTLLSWIVPMAVFFGLWMLFFRGFAAKQGFGGLMNVGKSKAKVYVEKETGVTFEDVAGVDEAKMELQEVVSVLMGQL